MKTIVLSGSIGYDITPEWFREELSVAKNEPVRLEINSPGGSVFAGREIINLVRSYPGRTEAAITGLAASMASAICVAADWLTVDDQSVFMFHKASGGVTGNSDDMAKMVEILEGIDETTATLYAEKSDRPIRGIQEMMETETWLFADEIVTEGFADEFTGDQHFTPASRSAAMVSAQSKFAASWKTPSYAEAAAYAGFDGKSTPNSGEVAKLKAWIDADPDNPLVADVVNRAILEGHTEADIIGELKAAVQGFGPALTDEDREAAKLVGMTEAEFRKYRSNHRGRAAGPLP